MFKQTAILLSSISLGLCIGLQAQASDDKEKSRISIVQQRLFDKKHEVGVAFGYLPDENFYEVFPVSVNYTYHFNERFAWEVIRASEMMNTEKDIKQDLETNFDVTPSTFDEPVSHIETSFILKPSYGKDAIWNKSTINHEGYLSFGFGVATRERHLSHGEAEQESDFTFSVGLGRKYFINEHINLSLDFKNIALFKEDEVEHSVYLGLGLNLRFNAFSSSRSKRNRDQSIYEYLK